MRDVATTDFDLIYDIYMDESVNPFMHYEPMDKDAFLDVFDELMRRDYFWVFQDDNDDDCGMASVKLGTGRTAHIAEIGSLAVKKAEQGKGLGKIIIEQIIAFLKAIDIERIQLFAESDNVSALRFYDALGFEREGLMKNYFKRGDGRCVDEVIYGLTDF